MVFVLARLLLVVSGRLFFSIREGFHDLPVVVPCGQCTGCRLERSRQWAIRCMHEAALYEDNCFITLTYRDECIPEDGSLDRRAFPLFMKRLRKVICPRKVRYFHAGEYGDESGRPHYHACLFGFDFGDKVPWTVRRGFPVWRSGLLESLWPFGLSEIGSVSFESAAYVARYIMKKVTGEAAADHYLVCDGDTGVVTSRMPEYTTMSRRPGIGRPWLDLYKCEVYPSDGVVVRGKLMKPPRAYDVAMDLISPQTMRRVRARRVGRIDPAENTPERLEVRAIVRDANPNRTERGL